MATEPIVPFVDLKAQNSSIKEGIAIDPELPGVAQRPTCRAIQEFFNAHLD
ncbi:MAG TPA: hypothetical protein VMM84_07975 [Pyrinomonadaceae bacterium]|nr:hypothetical protein [Pyrinomonadaceae bacterium]